MKFIPHLITSGNLFCGILALLYLGDGQLIPASYCIFIAGLLDFFDGFAARLLKVAGDFGKQLDSLADVVTFGVVPGMMLFKIAQQLTLWPYGQSAPLLVVYLPLLIGVFSALRLAKFNIDTRQANSFLGLPTPANAFWIASMPFIIKAYPSWVQDAWISPYTLAAMAVLSCILLVSEIPLLALKFKNWSFKNNWAAYLLLIGMGISLIVFKFAGLLALVPLYILFSVIDNQLKNNEITG